MMMGYMARRVGNLSLPSRGRIIDTSVSGGSNQPQEKGGSKESAFNDTLKDSIVQAMSNLLGQSGMNAALVHLQLLQLVKDPQKFHENLQDIFKEGARTIESVVIKELYGRLGVIYVESENFDFVSEINHAARMLSATERWA